MIINLQKGQSIFSKRLLTEGMMRHWKYAQETAQLGGGFMLNTGFKIAEVNWATPGNMWVKVEVPGSHPTRYIKISGEEFSWNFKTHRG